MKIRYFFEVMNHSLLIGLGGICIFSVLSCSSVAPLESPKLAEKKQELRAESPVKKVPKKKVVKSKKAPVKKKKVVKSKKAPVKKTKTPIKAPALAQKNDLPVKNQTSEEPVILPNDKANGSTNEKKKENKAAETVSLESPPSRPKPPKKATVLKTATPVLGRDGYVHNPYNFDEHIDVRGLPSGSVVTPNGKQSQKFKVP